jgi:hypothetical protein
VRLVLVVEPGVEVDLNPCRNEEIDGLRFGVVLVDTATRLREIVGYDNGDAVIERFDFRGHDASWPRDRDH